MDGAPDALQGHKAGGNAEHDEISILMRNSRDALIGSFNQDIIEKDHGKRLPVKNLVDIQRCIPLVHYFAERHCRCVEHIGRKRVCNSVQIKR